MFYFCNNYNHVPEYFMIVFIKTNRVLKNIIKLEMVAFIPSS